MTNNLKHIIMPDGTKLDLPMVNINDIELNNPYSLFDSKYSDHELNNLSWLKSEGQWNSKAVYTEAYDKLLKVYNGTEIVEGLSVKLSTETYTDYDFVLNTTDETFRLPLKTKLASGKAVVGNGMTLGITDNNKNYGLGTDSSAYVKPMISAYGTNAGTSSSSSSNINKTIGITTDPTKSGIELSDSGLYLYFYVGETVQNANLIDAGRIGEQLANKVDTSNTQWATNACMPDYSAGVSKSANEIYTASYDCFVAVLLRYSNIMGGCEIQLYDTNNNLILTQGNTGPNSSSSANSTSLFIPKNYKYKVLFSVGTISISEYPLKGAN